MRRLLVPAGSLLTGPLTLPAELSHYVRNVLRLRPGETLRISDGAGRFADAQLVASLKGRGEILHVQAVSVAPRAGPRLHLIQALGKGDKMDAVVRQAVELGCSRITPLRSARSVAEHRGREDRWKMIAEDAIRVSGRLYRAEIDPIGELPAVLGRPRAPLALIFDEGGPDFARRAIEEPAIEVMVGPEGGFDRDEVKAAEAAGFVRVGLGRYNLRTETAGPAVLAILGYLAGGFSA